MNHPLSPQWTVVGAGPAGIASIGKLLDSGIKPGQILWIDPVFKVGDLGQKWHAVSSNTKVGLFLDFLNACESFQYATCPHDFELNNLLREDTCILKAISEPLQWVTDHLRQIVPNKCAWVEEISILDEKWSLIVNDEMGQKVISTQRLILAIGAEPITFDIPEDKKLLPLTTLLDPAQLRGEITPNDTIAVFGSSHTAIIALYQLMDLNVNVINFYRSPLKYAEYHKDWILHDNTGLKGYSAQWARENLDNKSLPNNDLPLLERIHLDAPVFEEKYHCCTKVIQAVGFTRRKSILLPGHLSHDLPYDDQTGIIAPGLYGIGIAFPQGHRDRAGHYEYRVGLWKFMDHLSQVLPLWIAQADEMVKR